MTAIKTRRQAAMIRDGIAQAIEAWDYNSFGRTWRHAVAFWDSKSLSDRAALRTYRKRYLAAKRYAEGAEVSRG